MNLQGISYKLLCQNLAETEYSLRNSKMKVSTSANGGRYDQLEYMRINFPLEWKSYVKNLNDRISNPFDIKSILATIPKKSETIKQI